jgi:RNA polymerase sigma-70 factor (sigma-E family)
MQQICTPERLGIEEARMTDDSGFEDFVRDRAAARYRYGFVLTGNPHDADDLVQDALLRLRSAWSRVRDQNDPVAFVRTTMARLHVSGWRWRRREWLTVAVPDRAVADDAMDRVAATDTDREIWRALATLPPRQRTVIVLRFYEHLTDAEIAVSLGVSRGTIRSQASRGMAKLRVMPALSLSTRSPS